MILARREILIKAAALLGAEVLSSCAPANTPKAQPNKTQEAPKTSAEFVAFDDISPTSKEECRKAIALLPNDDIRKFTEKWGLPFLQDVVPSSLELGTHQIKIYDVRVVTEKLNRVRGIFKPIDREKSKPLVAKNNGKIEIILPFENEGNDTRAGMGYQPTTELATGVEMQITYGYPIGLYTPKNKVAEYLETRKTVLAKESITMAYFLAYLALMNGRMDMYDLPKTSQIEGQRVDFIVTGFAHANLLSEFLKGGLDIGPYLLTHNAYGSKEFGLDRINFGSSEEEIISNTFKFILANKAALSNAVGVRYNLNQSLSSPKK